MVVSDARREANRRNALKSTGPKTEEGKAKARQNALKHGLTSLVVVAEDAERFQARAVAFYQALKPQDEWQAWISEGAAMITLRIDRVERIERKLREKASWRASAFWDDDRRLEAERLGSTLGQDPARVVGELRMTKTGCDWLIERWAILAAIADRHPWTDAQKTLAYNMLGTPLEAREDAVGTLIDELGSRLDAQPSEAEVARDAIVGLRLRRDRAAEIDEIDQSLAQADLAEDNGPDFQRLRRYELTLQKRLRWYLQQMDREPLQGMARPYYKPNYYNPPENLDNPDLETPIGAPAPNISEAADWAEWSEPSDAEETSTDTTLHGTNPLRDETKPFAEMDPPVDAIEAEPIGPEADPTPSTGLDEEDSEARGDDRWAESIRDQVERSRANPRNKAQRRRVLVES